MLPLIPKSVKMEPDVSSRLKSVAGLIGYSENQFIVESVKLTLDVADDENNTIPRIVVMIRSARSHQKSPPQFGKPTAMPSSRSGVSRWWGE
jgi:hypothetical protein